ncbi:MAG: GIY-YIG nuclease family protein [Candidatus Omnitrophota bacterium]
MRRKIKRRDRYFVYFVECSIGMYYAGYTNDLDARIKLHNSGHGARYLRGKLPVKLVYAKEYKNYKNALRGERNLKKLTRKQKEDSIRIYERNKIYT